MPTYSYKCTECDHAFDAFQSIKDEPIKSCPECSGIVQRMIGAGAGIVFKGSGFYVNDYKKTGDSAVATKESKPEPAKAAEKTKSNKSSDS